MDGPPECSVVIGRYRLMALLGEGGMAAVYRARLEGPVGFRKDVALKRIRRSALRKDHKRERALINEARLGGRLRHPNIVETYELDEVEGDWFLALEWIDGWSLDVLLSHCRRQQVWMPQSVAAEIFQAVLRGLEYAHDLKEDGEVVGVVHRDLKPANVMVGRDGAVKLMDFGIAKSATNLFQTTEQGSVKGTPAYMSPEQAFGEPLDRRSDLFSAGSLLHELFTLELPFQADNVPLLVRRIGEADLTEPRARLAKRCPSLLDVFERLAAREPEQRFENAQGVLALFDERKRSLRPGPTLKEWLEDIEADLPVSPADGDFGLGGPPTAPTVAPETPRTAPPTTDSEVSPPVPASSRTTQWLVLVIVLLVGALGGGVAFLLLSPSPGSDPGTELRTDLLVIDRSELVRLASVETVDGARRFLADGGTVNMKDVEGTITATFNNGTTVDLSPGVDLEHTECTCDSAGVCLHRVVAVLQYQTQHPDHGAHAH